LEALFLTIKLIYRGVNNVYILVVKVLIFLKSRIGYIYMPNKSVKNSIIINYYIKFNRLKILLYINKINIYIMQLPTKKPLK